MFDQDPELSPDLVWLLQSQQVENGLLSRMLVQETYAQLLPFWEALLDDPQKAKDAALETFSVALLKTSTFREPQTVRSWLIGLAVELYRKDGQKLKLGHKPVKEKGLHLGKLSPGSRLAVVLRFRLDYASEEVAQFLGEKPAAMETRLWAARQLLLGQIGKSNVGSKQPAEADPLAQALQQAYPTQQFSDVDLVLTSQEVIRRAKHKRSRQRRSAYLKEIGMISVVILVVLVWMGRAHLDAPDGTPKPPAEKAFSVGTLRPGRQPSATPSLHPTQMAPGRMSTFTLMPTQLGPTPIPEDAFYAVQEGDTLMEIAADLGTSVEELRSLNRLPEEANLNPGEQLLKPGSLRINTPIPYAEFSRSRPTPTPAAAPLTSDEILESLNSFYFNSFWVDLQYIYRGPEGYRGEAQTYRMQWWDTPSGALILDGQNQNRPDEAIKWWRWSMNEYYVAKLASGSPWFQRNDYTGVISQLIEPLNFVFNLHTDYWKDQWINTVVVGSGQVRDRPVYILRQLNSQQQLVRTLWIDQVSSLPLHIQVSDLHNPHHITTEMLVTGLEINPDIPTAFFNPQIPWMGGYAKNSRGDPFEPGENLPPWKEVPAPNIERPYTPAPPNLNLANSPLQFQYGQITPIFPNAEIENLYEVEIFTSGKYLGTTLLPSPFFTLCARSPDGLRLAYTQASPNSLDVFSRHSFPGFRLRWFDLSNPPMVHTAASILHPFAFTFSPDGEQLAVYGEDLTHRRGIYLVDLQRDDLYFLQAANLVYSLSWKPDGKQMAYISQSEGSPSNASLVILDMESEKVVSRQSFPTPGDPPALNVLTQPPLQWGVPFPVGMGDLSACAAAPLGK